MKHLFTSERLGFRNWTDDDIPKMIAISADPLVMRYFPAIVPADKTTAFVKRMQNEFDEKQYCYFAVDRLDTYEFIGFIGLLDQNFDVPFMPATDIGWRLHHKHWNLGFATEGAVRCLEYGFNDIGLKSIVATAPLANTNSINVMKKAGMQFKTEFIHPRLIGNSLIEKCACYEAIRP